MNFSISKIKKDKAQEELVMVIVQANNNKTILNTSLKL
jgi:hypothetical protein